MTAQNTSKINVFIDEDYSHKKVPESQIGRKGYSLFRLRDMDVPVPRFFSISGRVFSNFINDNVGPSLNESITSEKIEKLIKDGTFDEKTAHDLNIGYSRISGFSSAWVSIRSSIILPDTHQKLSFAGQLDTILNSRGIEELLEAVKSVYASAFTKEVTTYLLSNGISLSDIKVGIVVQKMVQAEVSGVAFTVDPITQKSNLMSIESVFGLGEVIADGDITPDQYVLDKDTLKFEEKKIAPQSWMMVRKIKHKQGEDGKQKVEISPLWQNRQKLDNKYIEELVKICMQIEKKEKEPQDVEWVFEGGHLWILQTSKASSIKLKEYDLDIKLDVDKSIRESVEQINKQEEAKKKFKTEMEEQKIDISKSKIDLNKKAEKEISDIMKEKPKSLRNILRKKASKRTNKNLSPYKNERLILTGIGASKGTFRGKIVIIRSKKDLEKSLKDENIIVLKDTPEEIEGKITLAGGIISDIGGITSDLATICREKGIPCVLGTHMASKILKDDETVLIDGKIGTIYGKRDSTVMEKLEKQYPGANDEQTNKQRDHIAPPVSAKATSRQELQDALAVNESTKTGKINTATKIYLDLSYGIKSVERSMDKIDLSDGISHIRLEDIYRKIGRHPGAYIDEGRSKEFIKDAAQQLSNIIELTKGDLVIIGIGSMNVGQYRQLTKGSSLEKYEDDEDITDSTAGLQRLLKRPKELELAIKIIKRVRNVHGHRNASIAVEYAGTPENVIEFKKSVSANGLRRSSTFKIYLMVDTPSIALIVDQYEDTGIDGMIIDIKSLKKLMMAPDYDSASILKIMDEIKDNLKDGICIVRFPGKSKKIMDKVVERGFHGIAVTRKNMEYARKNIIKLERKALL
jgi:pyruvate,water dikinase